MMKGRARRIERGAQESGEEKNDVDRGKEGEKGAIGRRSHDREVKEAGSRKPAVGNIKFRTATQPQQDFRVTERLSR
jgi:hypothetical protein